MTFLFNDEQQKKSGKIRRVGIGGHPLQNKCRCAARGKKICEKLSPNLKTVTGIFHCPGRTINIHEAVFFI